jgi:hypothetical protein
LEIVSKAVEWLFYSLDRFSKIEYGSDFGRTSFLGEGVSGASRYMVTRDWI